METYSIYNVSVVLFAAFGSLFGGYGLAVITATLGQPTFYTSLGLTADPSSPDYSHTNTIVAAVNGVFFAGGVIGCCYAPILGDKLGRVRGFQIAAAVGIIGSAIQTGATNTGMYLAARVITGLATGHTVAAMPTYFSEVAPPHSRGLMAGAHGTFINVGYAVAQWVGLGCYYAPNTTFSWRFPNAVLLLWALCLLGGTFFIPESPRWLCTHGREDRALKILCRLHHDPKDPEDSFAHKEFVLIKDQIAVDHQEMVSHGKWQLFTLQTYRKRLILATMTIVGSQNTGVLVINTYNALLYQSLGLSNSQALFVSAGYNTWAMIANMCGAAASDRIGRRKALLTGFSISGVFFAIATALIAKYTEDQTENYAAAAVVFLFLYVFAYGSAIDVNMFTLASEIFPSHLRTQGSGIAVAGLFATDLLWLQLAPTATASIGWKYYLVFICLNVVHTTYLFFRLPETAGLNLEEIDVLFGKTPANRADDISPEKAGGREQLEEREQGSDLGGEHEGLERSVVAAGGEKV